jgi:hypothetical protein
LAATLRSISSKTATLRVPLDEKNPDGGTVELTYKPKAFSRSYERQFNDLMAHQSEQMVGAEITVRTFLLMVTGWDLKWDESDADPIPLTPEGLEDVPTQTLQYLLRKIGEDQQPDPTTKTS